MERREFLKYSTFFSTSLCAEATLFCRTRAAHVFGNTERSLVVIELAGGFDGLNTVIPYRRDAYYAARPNLAISPQRVLKVTDSFGFHPSLGAIRELYDKGKIAIVQGVGYPNPNRCHSRSMDIWHRGAVKETEVNGWLARYFDREQNSESFQGVYMDNKAPGVLSSTASSEKNRVVRLELLTDNLKNRKKYRDYVRYPDTAFAGNLRKIAKIIAAECGVKIFYTKISGFDTHINQVENGNNIIGVHAGLLATFSSGISAFLDDIKKMGKEREVLIMTFSEFGRRVYENASLGTDHGTANPMFFIGGKVNPGFYGEHPSLEDDHLDAVKDIVYKIDFRSVYSTILAKWLNADPFPIMEESWPLLRFI